MKIFELTEEQVKVTRKFLSDLVDNYELEYITITLEPVKDKENKYYIKTRTKAKEFFDISIVFDELNATLRIEMDTENFIYSQIY